MTDYPSMICWDCGSEHGRVIAGRISSWYPGICGWCKQETDVTEPRDFGYPKFEEKK